MERQGVVSDAYIHNALISRYSKLGNINKALAFHNEMILEGIKINFLIVNVILKCFYHVGLAFKTILIFQEFKLIGVFLGKFCYNVPLDALCKLKQVEDTNELFNKL